MASGQDPVGSQHNEWINKRRQIQQDYATQSAEAETKYQQNIAQLHREIEDEFNSFRRTLDELFQSHMREKQGLLDERRRIRQEIFQRAYDQDTKRLKDKFDQDLSKHDMEYYKYFQKPGATSSPGPAPPAPPPHVPSPVPMKPPMQAPPLAQQPRPILESQHRQIQPQLPPPPLRAPLQPPQQPPQQQPLQQPPQHLPPQLAHPRPQPPLVPLPSQQQPLPPPPPLPSQQQQHIQPAQPVQPLSRPSSFGPGPANRAGPPVDVIMAEARPFVAAPVDASAMAAAQSESELQNARPRSRRGRPPASGFSAVNASMSDDEESSRGRSRAQSRPDTIRDKSTVKRRARSVATPNRAKRTRTSPGSGGPSDGEEHAQPVRGLSESNMQRTATFDEIYQGGNAVYKHLIVDYPPGSERWYIIRCDEHGVHFNNTNPIAGAAKHLNGKDHNHMSKDRAQAVDLLGIRIVDCNRELAALNNNMVNAAFANGYKPFTHKDRHTRLAFNPDGSPKTDAQKAEAFAQAKAARAVASSMRHSLGGLPPRPVKPVVPEPKGVVDAKPGEIYYGYWTKNQTKYAVVVCGWDDQKCIGHSGRMLGELWPKLLKGAPRCYTVDLNRGIITGWAPGYEDGGSYQHKRHYAVQFFDQSRGVAWLQCRYLSEFKMDDPDRPDNPDDAYNQAREFYAKLRGFKDFEEWKTAGAVHGPVSNDNIESLGSESRYDTPGENPSGPGMQDHGGDDDDMSVGFEGGPRIHDDDDYDPEQTESEDEFMEDAPDLDESFRRSRDTSRRQSAAGIQRTGESTDSPSIRKSASHEPRTLSPPATASSTAAANAAATEANSNVAMGSLFQRVKNALTTPNSQSPSSPKNPADMASSALKQITASATKVGEQQNGSAASFKLSASPDATPSATGANGSPVTHPELGQNGTTNSVPKANGSGGPAADHGETHTRSSVSQVSLNGSRNGTPIISARSLNGTPASSVAGTPTPTAPQSTADRWKAVNARPIAPAGQMGQKTQISTTSTPASPTAPVKQELNISNSESWFDLAAYSGQDGEYNSGDHSGKLLRLKVNNDSQCGETDKADPVQVKIDPLQIVKMVVDQEGDKTIVSMYGNTDKPQHRVTFIASKDAQDRPVVAKIHGRRFAKWLRNRNPQIPHYAA